MYQWIKLKDEFNPDSNLRNVYIENINISD